LAEDPNLSAAVLDSESEVLCARLAQRSIPFVMFTGRQQVPDKCAAAPLIRKPASVEDVVAEVKRLLP
jgi:hypothetical protein